ncbi:PREDICTED: putative gustatory receptor 2a, partial [Vollenhovia emeryi]|uniref:putative gustatory receptor 2a n=1 Tax=Vollenhovia emeryi TaxID=411798 RepID=UPI0005F4D9AE
SGKRQSQRYDTRSHDTFSGTIFNITSFIIDLLQLKQFSLQLLHRKLAFTANGYFALDNSFLHSLIGTVATYLVILVQFQMGSSCSSKPQCNCTGENVS